ncbi:TPA: phage tail protein [Pseudomonas aeruginosa]|nr:phage tail protein [Pseudomonas aeruginosa]
MNYFCAADGGFYSLAFHGFIPDGAVAVSDEEYAALQEGQAQGKWLVANDQGYPVLREPSESPGWFAAIERGWRDEQLSVTDSLVVRHRDELEEGVDTTLTSVEYAELQVYRRALRTWPESKEFPLQAHRPAAPPWLASQGLQ